METLYDILHVFLQKLCWSSLDCTIKIKGASSKMQWAQVTRGIHVICWVMLFAACQQRPNRVSHISILIKALQILLLKKRYGYVKWSWNFSGMWYGEVRYVSQPRASLCLTKSISLLLLQKLFRLWYGKCRGIYKTTLISKTFWTNICLPMKKSLPV